MRTVAAPALALLGNRVMMAQLVEMYLTSTLYVTTARDTLVASTKRPDNGVLQANTYLGGRQTAIDRITDQGGQIAGVSFQISGVSLDTLAIALAEPIQGKLVRVFTCFMDPDTWAVLDVMQSWAGTLDQMPINQGVASATVTVTADHRGISFARPKGYRYTDADQQLLYPNDLSLQFIVAQAQHQDVWPAAAFFRQ